MFWSFQVLAYSEILMYTTITVILFNVVVMALDRECDYRIEGDYCRIFKRELERSNIFFTSFFALELIIKMIGCTPLVYLKETGSHLLESSHLSISPDIPPASPIALILRKSEASFCTCTLTSDHTRTLTLQQMYSTSSSSQHP